MTRHLTRLIRPALTSARSPCTCLALPLARPASLTPTRRSFNPPSFRSYSDQKLPRPDEHNVKEGDIGLQELRQQVSDVPIGLYQTVSEETMDTLTDTFEDLIEELALAGNAEAKSFDVEYSSGVLTLSLGEKGTYVINKQPPNKQIWLSSPVSGPKRYDLDPKTSIWYYARDGSTLKELLEKELVDLLEREVEIDIKGGEEY